MKPKQGFTVVELITVLGIIAILVAILLPAVNMVRTKVKTTQQKAQFNSIGMALEAFKSDFGEYPESAIAGHSPTYGGGQKLAEAMFGRDLLGFHPDSRFSTDGTDADGNNLYPDNPDEQNLQQRTDLYLDPTNVDVYEAADVFVNPNGIDQDSPVICDVFTTDRRVQFGDEFETIGTPILYYKANTERMQFDDPGDRYDVRDNRPLYNQTPLADPDTQHGFQENEQLFYNGPNDNEPYKIVDPRVTTRDWPRRPDSFILISAGPDGRYGTSDDIFNF